MNNKTIIITIKEVPDSFLSGMKNIMVAGKLQVHKEVMKPPDDNNFTIDFRDALLSLEHMQMMNLMISTAFSLYTSNPDGKETPKIDI